MTSTVATLPVLPHWESTPSDLKAAIRQIKAALRERIAASGRTVEEVFAVVEERVAARVAEIVAEKQRGETVWPVIDYADIDAGTVPAEALQKLRHRGCLVVRGHFPREQALASSRSGSRPAWRRSSRRSSAVRRLGPVHRRLRRGEPVLRELPRSW